MFSEKIFIDLNQLNSNNTNYSQIIQIQGDIIGQAASLNGDRLFSKENLPKYCVELLKINEFVKFQ